MLKKATTSLRRRERDRALAPRNCVFCQEGMFPTWKNPEQLRRFTSERGRILSADKTGLCAKHQRRLTKAIKQARHLGLLLFVAQVK